MIHYSARAMVLWYTSCLRNKHLRVWIDHLFSLPLSLGPPCFSTLHKKKSEFSQCMILTVGCELNNHSIAGPNSTWPPISTVVPTFNLSLPSGISCGQVSNGATNGSYRSPGFPEYMYGLHCAYVIEVPKGYYVNITLRNFALQQRCVWGMI